jgi:hypothetical protein
MVSAPAATLAWLRDQANSPKPRVAELIRVLQYWGFWARAGHERMYAPDLAAVAASLSNSAAVTADDEATAVLLKFIGDVRSEAASAFVVGRLASATSPAVRAAAATAAGQLGSDQAAAAVCRVAATEADPGVQEKLAVAAASFPDRIDVGEAVLRMFDRATAPAPRREILYACSASHWPQRPALIQKAFDDPDAGVLGAALSALAVRTEPAIDKTLAIAAVSLEGQPPLIDALAAYADPRAVPHLTRWLGKEQNPVVRVKLLLALDRTARGDQADDLFLRTLKNDASAMVVEQAAGVVGRRGIAAGAETIRALAIDATAPMQLRVGAVFALGGFDTPDNRRAVRELDRDADKVFKDAVDADGRAAYAEQLDMARMMIALALMRLGDPDGSEKLQAAYDRGTGMSRLTALVMLAETKRDHAIIARGLESADTAILYGAARAAAAADPKKYRDRLTAIRTAPFVRALLDSGLDSSNLRDTLDHANELGERP